MPKELIHFKTAELTAMRLTGSRFAPCIEARPRGVLVGAVFHDALFFAAMPRALPMAGMAHRIHGAKGEDTHALLRLQARHAASTQDRDLAAALLVGMASHLWADTVMHPMVWHLTGDYYAPSRREKSLARQRHRALESIMDMVACPEMLGRPLYHLGNLLGSLGPALFEALPMAGMADLADIPADKAVPALRSAFTLFARFQAQFAKRGPARLAYALAPLLPDTVREIAALFYAPQWLDQADRMRGPVAFRNPVSGVADEASLVELMDRAADRAAELCRALEPAVFDGAELVLPEIGPSLDSGKPSTGTERMRHLADPPFPKLPQHLR